jgi:hypothetical protein
MVVLYIYLEKEILTMLNLMKKYYLDITFFALVVVGFVITTKLIYFIGIDYWNWEILPASAPAALRETAENYYTVAQLEVVGMYVFMGLLAPFVATMYVAYRNDPELHQK